MIDQPWPQNNSWSHPDSDLPEDDNANVNVFSLNEVETEELTRTTFSESLMLDQDIANYIAYLDRPVVNINDQYLLGIVPPRPPTRRKHRADLKYSQIVDNKGINMIKNMEYSEFLVKKDLENQALRVLSERSSDEENGNTDDQYTLRLQSQARFYEENHMKMKRGQTSAMSENLQQDEPRPRRFLRFRTAKKNKNGRQKTKLVVGEDGVDGPIWPAVLLTFDRNISPSLPESSEESDV